MSSHRTAFRSCLALLAGVLVPASGFAQTPTLIDLMGFSLDSPIDLVADELGNVYVADLGDDKALKVTPGGVVTRILDSAGDGRGAPLAGLLDLAVDGTGNVYAAAITSDNVFRVEPGGTVVEILDASGDGSGATLDGPGRVAAFDGTVYVTGSVSDNVFRIEPDGTVTEVMDASGDGLGNTLNTPVGITVDSVGRVYVLGLDSDNLFRIDLDGTVTELASGLGRPSELVVTTAGLVVVASLDLDAVFALRPGGSVTTVVSAQGDGFGNLLDEPDGVALDADGNLFVVGRDSDNAFSVDLSTGGVREILDETGDGTTAFDFPRGIATVPSGTVYVVGIDGNLFAIEDPPLPVSLVARWALDGDTTSRPDPAWDGLASPGVTFEDGRVGQAMRFDGGSAAVTTSCNCGAPVSCVVDPAPGVDHFDSLETTSAADFAEGFSVMGWIRADPRGGIVLDHSQACCGACFLGFRVGVRPTGAVYVELASDAGTLVAETAPKALAAKPCWTHVAATWNGDPDGGVRIFVDNVALPVSVSDLGFTGLDAVGVLPTRVGAGHAGASDTVEGFTGLVDELSLWRRDLPALIVDAEVGAHPSVEAPLFDSRVCGATLAATVGVPLSVEFVARDCDLLDSVVLVGDPTGSGTPSGLPAGATLTPPMPLGNPVTALFEWTPTSADVGTHTVRILARDTTMLTTTCEVTIEVGECYLLLADAPGADPFAQGGHTFATQLGGTTSVFPVTMEQGPAIALAEILRRRAPGVLAPPSAAPLLPVSMGGPARGSTGAGRLYFAQVLMWNPQVFPANPEQWSRGVAVWVTPTLEVITFPFGSENGIALTPTLATGPGDEPVLTFPFAIDGL